MTDKFFLTDESDHELDDEVLLGLSKCELRAVSVCHSYRFELQLQPKVKT